MDKCVSLPNKQTNMTCTSIYKKYVNYKLNVKYGTNNENVVLSRSLDAYKKNIENEVISFNLRLYEDIQKEIHNIIFYELFEIIKMCANDLGISSLYGSSSMNVYVDSVNEKVIMNCLMLKKIRCINIKEKNMMVNLIIKEINDYENINNYVYGMLNTIIDINERLLSGGNMLIKIGELTKKSIIDCILLFSALFDKISIIKPSMSNIYMNDRYILCHNYSSNVSEEMINDIKIIMRMIKEKVNDDVILSLIDNECPKIFMNKLEEINVIIGQQQMEYYDAICSAMKHKNREERLEILRRNYRSRLTGLVEKRGICAGY
jgi:hypothetical protein